MIETETLENMPRQYHESYLNQKMGFDDWLCECSDKVRAEAMDAGLKFMTGKMAKGANLAHAMISEYRSLELSYNEYLEGGVL